MPTECPKWRPFQAVLLRREDRQADAVSTARGRRRQEIVCLIGLWGAILGYCLFFSLLAVHLLKNLDMMAFDVGIFDQAAWLISRGQPAFVTIRGMHILGDHFSAIMYLLAPLYWIAPTPKTLLIFQTVALAAGALPVYGLAMRGTHSAPVALLFAWAYLLYPALQWSNVYEFHPDTLATPLLIGALYCLDARRWRSYFVCLTLALLTKETAGVTVILVGVYALRAHRSLGLWTVAQGVLGLAIAFATMSHFNNGTSSAYLSLYSRYGDSPLQIVFYIAHHPAAALSDLNTNMNGVYLLKLLYPLAFLPLMAPDMLLIAAPALLMNLLSSRHMMHTIYQQYTAFVTPFLVVAAVIGIGRLQRYGTKLALAVPALCLLALAVDATQWGPLRLPIPWLAARTHPPEQVLEAERTVQLLPVSASLSAQAALAPTLSCRRLVYTFPNPFYPAAWGGGARVLQHYEGKGYAPYSTASLDAAFAHPQVEYIVLCSESGTFPLTADMYPDFVAAALRSRAFGITSIGRWTILLQRGADHEAGLRLLTARVGRTTLSSEQIMRAVQVLSSDVSLEH